MRLLVISLLLSIFLSSCASKKQKILRNPTVSEKKEKAEKVWSNSSNTDFGRPSNKNSTSSSMEGVSMSGLDYISLHKDIAIHEMNTYGIPASIKLAQAILESGSGNSYLAKNANNHFGIKCGGTWTGESIARDDDHPNDCFRVYANVEESYKDHSQFLLRKRYEKLFALDKDDYKGWAKGLKEAGYATNPRYPELLISLIERYNLHEYDRHESSHAKKKREHRVDRLISESTISTTDVAKDDIKSSSAMVIHEVKASETLYGISKKYNVTVNQIKKLNNLSSDHLSIGQVLLISK